MTKQRSPLHFRFLTGDVNWLDYGGKWISKKLNNGEFDYWLVIELINMQDAAGEDDPKQRYNVSVQVVSPSQAGEENCRSACNSCGVDYEEFKDKPLCLVEMLSSYGTYAIIWNDNGGNAYNMLKEARKQAFLHGDFLFGFAMDRAQNAIGSTGWDFIRGNILAGIKKHTEG